MDKTAAQILLLLLVEKQRWYRAVVGLFFLFLMNLQLFILLTHTHRKQSCAKTQHNIHIRQHVKHKMNILKGKIIILVWLLINLMEHYFYISPLSFVFWHVDTDVEAFTIFQVIKLIWLMKITQINIVSHTDTHSY